MQVKIGVCLNDDGFVAPFPQAAGALVAAVDVLDVAPPECLHELGDPGPGFGADQQVDVVGHEDVGVEGAMPIGSRFLKPVEVAVVVLLGKEAGLSVDATLDDMLRQAG